MGVLTQHFLLLLDQIKIINWKHTMVSYEVATESTMYYCLFFVASDLSHRFLKVWLRDHHMLQTTGKQANRVRYFVSHYLWAVRNGHIMSSCHETTRSSLGAMETYYSQVNPCQDYEKVL